MLNKIVEKTYSLVNIDADQISLRDCALGAGPALCVLVTLLCGDLGFSTVSLTGRLSQVTLAVTSHTCCHKSHLLVWGPQ